MGRYVETKNDIYSIFATEGWLAEGIKTMPANFNGPLAANTSQYIRVDIIMSGRNKSNPLISTEGLILIDIFATAGEGQTSTLTLADKLDSYLIGKTLQTGSGGSTQMLESSLGKSSIDTDNPGLIMTTYSIPFSYYGVF